MFYFVPARHAEIFMYTESDNCEPVLACKVLVQHQLIIMLVSSCRFIFTYIIINILMQNESLSIESTHYKVRKVLNSVGQKVLIDLISFVITVKQTWGQLNFIFFIGHTHNYNQIHSEIIFTTA